jgi:AcrR family transcriptional regulator
MPKSGNGAAPKRLRGRPRDPERCRRILQASSHHFNTHGFEQASMDAIAADADGSRMTIYSNFGSKEGFPTRGMRSLLPAGSRSADRRLAYLRRAKRT